MIEPFLVLWIVLRMCTIERLTASRSPLGSLNFAPVSGATTAGRLESVDPTRLLDTRSSVGMRPAGSITNVRVAGAAGLPNDPAAVAVMLDVALAQQESVVYAAPTNRPPHSALRNLGSRSSKRVVKSLSGGVDASVFHSYRLVLGEVGRSVAAYTSSRAFEFPQRTPP